MISVANVLGIALLGGRSERQQSSKNLPCLNVRYEGSGSRKIRSLEERQNH